MKKVLAGQGAVDYYLAQDRRGLADYYLPAAGDGAGAGGAQLAAPGSGWWGGGAATLGLDGPVERDQFVSLYAKGVRPGGGYLGRKFRLPGQAAAARAAAEVEAGTHDHPYDRWTARHHIRRTGAHASVAAWDCTFSPVKSVSLLWAAGDRHIQQQVWAAHTTAVEAGLEYLQEHAGYVRAGRNGVRVLDTTGLVVARMNEWTSRDGDMQLHTHCLVLNRARTAVDGKWRAIDGRALLSARTGAGAIYARVLEVELTRWLDVAWRDRADGLRELVGVDDELIEVFSSRRRAITSRVDEMAEAYERRYGIAPPPAVLSAMAQDATLATRNAKRKVDADQALAAWEATARRRGRDLRRLPRRVLGQSPFTRGVEPADAAAAVVARLENWGRSTFSTHDLLRAALDVLPTPTGSMFPAVLQARAQRLVDQVTDRPDLVVATPHDVIDAPDPLRRADGTSVYEQPDRHRWTLRTTLDREAWLLQVATEPTGHTVPVSALDGAIADHRLGHDQRAAVTDLLGADRRIGCLVGPAGAGKTRTLRAVADAWQADGGDVIGLTVSQAAAGVLAAEAEIRTENVAKWLHETRRGRWRLPDGALVLVDEASMASTADLVTLVAQARHAGGRVLLVGDPAQLAAIHIGGAFDLLADRHGAARLTEIRRFTQPWEADASARLRRRDPAALAAYAMRGRIHGGTTDQLESDLFDAWRADALGIDDHGARQSVLMVVTTNEQAAVLGDRARQALQAAGLVSRGPSVRLADNAASVGDHLVTRRNDRRLTVDGGDAGFVVNGDLWTLQHLHPDGGATAIRHRDGATVTLPADYLAAHTHLGYATTAHRAQGMTVDLCHALVTVDATHQHLYVAATRGRHGNHLWVAVDSDRQQVRDPDDLPAPEQIFDQVLQRTDVDRLSAHQVIGDSQTAISSLARLGAIFEDAARQTTETWLATELAAHGLDNVAGDRHWPSLVTRLRQAALAGHDHAELVHRALTMRPIGGAQSMAAVLHWRIAQLTDTVEPARRPGPLASLPDIDAPELAVARQAGELMRQRWRQLRRQLDRITAPLPWAEHLGPRPTGGPGSLTWLTAATAIAAYRERFEIPDHTPGLGPRPADSRPDAQAAYDHARHQTDLHLSRSYHDLDHRQLADLDRQQQAVLDRRPTFDPAGLEQVHRGHDRADRAWRTATGSARARASLVRTRATEIRDAHEHTADRHAQWRRAATQASDRRRQLRLGAGRQPGSVATGARRRRAAR